MSRLTAACHPLGGDEPVDPFSLAGEEGILLSDGNRTIVGLGTALECTVDDALASLAAIPCRDTVGRPGSGVLALGALPFHPVAEGRLVVPELAYVLDEHGVAWVTVVGDRALVDGAADVRDLLSRWAPPAVAGPARRPAGTLRGEVGAKGTRADPGSSPRRDATAASEADLLLPSEEEFAASVAEALDAIADGGVSKVVLARHLEISVGRGFSVAAVLRRFRSIEPSCTAFSFPVPQGRFAGATPELLVSRRGAEVRCQPLAGTGGTADGDADRLLGSGKDAEEHRLVVSAIADVLRTRCSRLDVPEHPTVVSLRSVAHLGTTLTGTLAGDGDRRPDALTLVAALHPTPAVGGTPVVRALELIEKLEPVGRGNYAGPVGWLDASGDGDWFLGIRSFTVRGERARLSAGAGIVAGSDPCLEVAETGSKLDSILAALRPSADSGDSGAAL